MTGAIGFKVDNHLLRTVRIQRYFWFWSLKSRLFYTINRKIFLK
ncbi:MAG: hypothetical protein OFPII_02220 [Osedax symbiont Rs1]|nr:MAG: hypothetical protein OFPII_02220 [Osedax symbiont Rs1]